MFYCLSLCNERTDVVDIELAYSFVACDVVTRQRVAANDKRATS